jgi:hypothetical protein
MNVLVYQLCADRLTVGFRDSEVVEEITCGPAGERASLDVRRS